MNDILDTPVLSEMRAEPPKPPSRQRTPKVSRSSSRSESLKATPATSATSYSTSPVPCLLQPTSLPSPKPQAPPIAFSSLSVPVPRIPSVSAPPPPPPLVRAPSCQHAAPEKGACAL